MNSLKLVIAQLINIRIGNDAPETFTRNVYVLEKKNETRANQIIHCVYGTDLHYSKILVNNAKFLIPNSHQIPEILIHDFKKTGFTEIPCRVPIRQDKTTPKGLFTWYVNGVFDAAIEPSEENSVYFSNYKFNATKYKLDHDLTSILITCKLNLRMILQKI